MHSAYVQDNVLIFVKFLGFVRRFLNVNTVIYLVSFQQLENNTKSKVDDWLPKTKVKHVFETLHLDIIEDNGDGDDNHKDDNDTIWGVLQSYLKQKLSCC